MTYLKKIATACAVAASLAAGSAAAAPITLTFEGVGDFATIDNYYAGGTSSNGASGTNHGIVFGAAFTGLVDSDAGGSGTIANMPSGSTVAYVLDESGTVNVAQGFEDALSFYFSAGDTGYVSVFAGQNGTGGLLASINLAGNNDSCLDANDLFCRFDLVNLAFDGVARSVVFGGVPGWIAYDNLTFGVEAAPGDVPEPATLGLTALGLAGLAAARRKAGAQR